MESFIIVLIVVLAQVISPAKHLVKRWLDYYVVLSSDNEIRRLQLLAIREKEKNPKQEEKAQAQN